MGVGWCRESGKGKKEVGRRESVYRVVAPLHLSHHFSACLPTVWFCPTQGPLVCPMSSELTQTHQLLSLTSSNFDYKLCVNTSQVYICSLSSLSQAQTTGISTWKSYWFIIFPSNCISLPAFWILLKVSPSFQPPGLETSDSSPLLMSDLLIQPVPVSLPPSEALPPLFPGLTHPPVHFCHPWSTF